ncbi:hypothetical protein IS481_12045 [Caldimonas thermodepolymerans]|uniref:Capsid Gp10A/Gp10B-like domain-containing protein n=1 Tax=Caldimonas thermodepolymerans TaxID=215580 RepID=A0A2S5T8Y3_9BURK|nr:phage capsid protein [Caldimonas thermodepolymerans]PPE71474.1 hypothetical protein C1702_00270 [Caldimonas thermodepolymerans]QPC30501.1 hypothetical protein IS481_12045 [Caldimonas thermodepolymerans]
MIPGQNKGTGDDRALFLKIAGGEVLKAFTAATIMAGKTRERTISGGKEAQFPRTGVSKAEYLSRGQEMLGNPYLMGEVTVGLDAPLVAHHDIWDFDALMAHFDFRSPIVSDMGQALARTFDQNVMRAIILAARTPQQHAAFNDGGTVHQSADLLSTGNIDGFKWVQELRKVRLALIKKNLPANMPLYGVVSPDVIDAIKWAKDPNSGQYVILDRNFAGGNAADVAGVTETVRVAGITLMASTLLPNTDESSASDVFAKYRADYSNTAGIVWAPDAVATLTLQGLKMETARDTRRLCDVLVASRFNGHGTLRSEFAVELRRPAAGGN